VSVSFSKRKKLSLKIIILNFGKSSLKLEYTLNVLQEKTQNFFLLGKQIRKFSEIECENSFLSFRVEVLEEKVNKSLKEKETD
jgi:hypothetical protein